MSEDTLRDELAAEMHLVRHGADCARGPQLTDYERADVLLPVVRREVEQARAEEREAAVKRVEALPGADGEALKAWAEHDQAIYALAINEAMWTIQQGGDPDV